MIKKLVNDTLKVNGKWAHKRCMSFASFHLGAAYAFTPTFYPAFEVKEFVVWAFFGFAAGCLGIDLQQKIKTQSDEWGNTYNSGTIINNKEEHIG